MVKVEDMVLDDMRAVDEVADDAAVIRYFISYAEGAIEVERSRDTVRLRADAADTLGDNLGVARVSAAQDDFQSAEQVAGRPGIFNRTVLDGALYF